MSTLSAEYRLELERLWDALMRYALWKGVPFPDAEDLVSSSLRKALEHQDDTRGDLLSYSRAILANAIKNFWRDRRNDLPFDDGEWSRQDGTPDIILEEKEKTESMKRTIERLSSVLSPEELAFMKMLGEVVDELGDRAVSETARRLGLQATKGWDLFRRIQRKANTLVAPAQPRIGRRKPPSAPRPASKQEEPTMAASERPSPDQNAKETNVAAFSAIVDLSGALDSDSVFTLAAAMARADGFQKFLTTL